MKTLTKELQSAITPALAIELLNEGNKRFVNNLKVNRNLLQQANDTSDGQHPFAVILSCIDSRTSAELIFDQGLGDVFSVRIAGNIINEDILGSMEFGCKVAGAKNNSSAWAYKMRRCERSLRLCRNGKPHCIINQNKTPS